MPLQQEDKAKVLELITEKLRMINVHKMILFGSYAWGTPDKDSDIDLLVVTNDEFMPQSYEEKSDIFCELQTVLKTLREKYPLI